MPDTSPSARSIALFRLHPSQLPHRLFLIRLPDREERRMPTVPPDTVPDSVILAIQDLKRGDRALCQYSILRKIVSISLVTERFPGWCR
jgi:hypothetical protein